MAPSFEALIAHVRGEYREMPGLGLTIAQASRLWDLDPVLCAEILKSLEAEGFLTRTDDNVFTLPSLRERRRHRREQAHLSDARR